MDQIIYYLHRHAKDDEMRKHGKNRKDEIGIKIVVAKHERKREREY